MARILLFLSLSSSILIDAILAQASTAGPVVNLSYAKYRGHYNSTLNITKYLGLPFAAPPTGQSSQIPSGAEDCLVLNVVQPRNATQNAKLPVIFFIHRGGYNTGDASQGSPYAIMRHTKNAFIFISSDKYTKEGRAPNVQKHICAFGGDLAKVIIMGVSAGKGSVISQIIMYGGVKQPLFRAALTDFPYYLLSATNCLTLACLRAIVEDKLKAATQATYIKAYAEGSYGYSTYYYGPEFRARHFTKVPTN
ncbi:alpha/beta-hydrolase [Periconia macrospinosa]|uniref:Carboxylic ester hydrolase n=1 Tax=Periconia macrospinosa TaxID=97972 RepID=A0A2V1DQW6_9PLEO|nr:alpha/beta-hydrolase [Periconia macrospinosa]